MKLTLERCTVRPWRLDDAESLTRHANNRKIWLGGRDLFPHPYTIQDAHEFLQRAISEQSEMKSCIELDGTAVGGIGVHPGQDVYGHTATVGYWLGEQFWGRGIMGIPGLILAPVVLNYLRVEMLTVEVPARHEEVEVLSR